MADHGNSVLKAEGQGPHNEVAGAASPPAHAHATGLAPRVVGAAVAGARTAAWGATAAATGLVATLSHLTPRRRGRGLGAAAAEAEEDLAAGGTAAALAAEQPATAATVAKLLEQNRVLDEGIRVTKEVLQKHPNAPLHIQRGWATEACTAASYNLDAIDRGLDLRASVVVGRVEDLQLVSKADPSKVVAMAQVKTSNDFSRLQSAMRDGRYEDMLKVSNVEVADPARGVSSSLRYGGVESKPYTLQELERATQDPQAHYDAMRPSTLMSGVQAMATGAAIGGLISGGVSLCATALSKEKVGYEDLKRAGAEAVVGATAGGTGNAVAVLCGMPLLGSVAGGAVLTGYQVYKCPDGRSKVLEGLKGVAGTSAALAAGGAVSMLLAPVGVTGLAAYGLMVPAAMVANIYSRKGVGMAADGQLPSWRPKL